MAKPELGTKRLCANCGTKFYDLSRSPIVCPKCATVFHVTPRVRPEAATPAMAAAAGAAMRPAVKDAEVEIPEIQEAEFVPLEEADAESKAGPVKVPVVEGADVDDEIEIDETLDDTAFIEEEEEGDEDVTDIVGEGRENEEET
ncbi:MAG TPA: TIGR02300 family protein [Xanthobacteraceae bacterium]|nr:TIGR02300 family protein [Xanthobacteraceae bacterium]